MSKDRRSERETIPRHGLPLEAAREIKRATGLELADGVEPERFCAAVNQLIQEVSIRSISFDPRGQRAKIERLRRAFDTYQTLAMELRQFGLYPPMPPSNWRRDADNWFVDTETFIEKQGADQTRTNALSSFYPRAAGLFKAAFDEIPTAWHDDSGSSSPLVLFSGAIIVAAKGAVDPSAIAGVGGEENERLSRLWTVRSGNAIRVAMQTTLKPRREVSDIEKTGNLTDASLEWENLAVFYSDFMGKT